MKKPVLVIMAAGMGSRYGGLKQIDPIDSYGNLIIDFSIFDAIKAGFEKVIFIIKKDMEADFKECIGNRISHIVETAYVHQELSGDTESFSIPGNRTKPWGTAHAVLSCAGLIASPFAVINADDYYGQSAFASIYQELCSTADIPAQHAMVGYLLEHTLTEYGYVSRGVCEIENNCWLKGMEEHTKINKNNNFPKGTVVSMNMWGFKESILPELKEQFHTFLMEEVPKNPTSCEFFLPSAITHLLQTGKSCVKVLESNDHWYGVTYKEDKPRVMAAIQSLKEKGIYPANLWEGLS